MKKVMCGMEKEEELKYTVSPDACCHRAQQRSSRPPNKDFDTLYFDSDVWGMSYYKNLAVECSFSAVSEPKFASND